MSAITPELLREKLQANIKGVELVTVADTSDGCGAKFAVVIVATVFETMTAVERHQAILGKAGVLADEMKTVRECLVGTDLPCVAAWLGRCLAAGYRPSAFRTKLVPFRLAVSCIQIHALELKAWTPKQFAARQAKEAAANTKAAAAAAVSSVAE
jgi:stress-induced morphogen